MKRTVAIVGRPNVGKSRLFNRLARKRISIVHDQPGITRDVVATEVADGGYTLLDTGGLGLKGDDSPADLLVASERQVHFAIDAANLILLVVDGLAGVTPLDERIAATLRRSGKSVLLVVNKADFGDEKVDLAGAYRLGLGDPVAVSAEHGQGEADLRALLRDRLGTVEEAEGELPAKTAADPLCVCFIGRPNVGKSSLSNQLLQSDRLIVSPTPGTTRDAVELPFQFLGRDGKPHDFRLIDTAGLKAAAKLASPVEYFSRLRSLEAIQRADVVFLVLDAIDGLTQLDKAIAGEALKDRKPVIVVVNKWDLVKQALRDASHPLPYRSEREYRDAYLEAIEERLYFSPGSPVIFVSAARGTEIDRMLNAAVKLNRTLDRKLPTAKLNQLLGHLTERTPPPSIGGRRFRIYYATQTGNRPFRIRVFCNREEKLTDSYSRYLEAGVSREFKLDGCPVNFELVGKERHRDRGKKSSE